MNKEDSYPSISSEVNQETLTNRTEETCEPETFDTWTLITDSINNNVKKDAPSEDKQFNRIEIIPEIKCPEQECSDDGISVISESESAGRNSPLPKVSEKSNDDKQKTNNDQNDFLMPSTSRKSRQLKKASIEIRENGSQTVDQANQRFSMLPFNLSIVQKSKIVIKKQFSIFFFWCAVAALIALFAKSKYPEWGNSYQNDLENEKIINLEMQNNLLHAEIDILSKKVNYLQQQYENNMKNSKYTTKNFNNRNKNIKETINVVEEDDDDEMIKVWPGGGRIERAEIPKKALKTPHSCDEPGQNFKDVCQNSKPETRQNSHSVQDDTEASENFIDNLRIIIDSVNKVMPADADNIQSVEHTEFEQNTNENNYKKYNPPAFNQRDELYKKPNDNREYGQRTQDNTKFNDESRKQKDKKKYSREFEKRDYNENVRHKHERHENYQRNESNDKTQKKRKSHEENYNYDNKQTEFDGRSQDEKWDTRKVENQHKERRKSVDSNRHNFDNNYRDKSREKSGDKGKKEYYNKKFDSRKGFDENEKREDWHESMMRDREESRKKNQKRKKDNWYMDRANGREEARMFEEPHKDKVENR